MSINLEDILYASSSGPNVPCAQQVSTRQPSLTRSRPKRGIDLEEILGGPLPEPEVPRTPPRKARRLPAPPAPPALPAFIPPASSNPQAAQVIFGNDDLFAIILSHLPEKDVLHAQRISRQFRAGIQGSETLQRKLFLRQRDKRTPAVRPNALLLWTTRLSSTKTYLDQLRPAVVQQGETWKFILLAYRNPSLESRRELHFLKFRDVTFRRSHAAFPDSPWPLVLSFRVSRLAFTNEEAVLQDARRSGSESWRRMHLSDSPRPIVWEVEGSPIPSSGDFASPVKQIGKLVAYGMIDANSTLGNLVEM